VGGLVVIYVALAIGAIWKDRRAIATARVPSPEELREFGSQALWLYKRPTTRRVLDTMHLAAWQDAFMTDAYPPGTLLTVWQRVYVTARFGLKYNHAYFSLLSPSSLTPGSQLARVSTMIASLFVTLVITATFYQDTQGLSTLSTIEHKVFSGLVTAVIVFVPFSLIGFLMRRVRHTALINPSGARLSRAFLSGGTGTTITNADMYSSSLNPAYHSQSTTATNPIYEGKQDGGVELADLGKQRTFDEAHNVDLILFETDLLDFYVPVWVEYVLYFVLFAASVASAVLSIFYGAQFADDVAVNWIESFFIGWAASAIVLQTVQSLVGSVFTALAGSVATIATGLFLLVTNGAIN